MESIVWLKRSLYAGALFDALFGMPLLGAPQAVADIFHITPPPDVYSRLIGLLLLMLAGIYYHAAQEPHRYVGVIVVAIAGRSAGACLFVAAALGRTAPAVFLYVGLVDLTLAVAHALWVRDLFRPADRP